MVNIDNVFNKLCAWMMLNFMIMCVFVIWFWFNVLKRGMVCMNWLMIMRCWMCCVCLVNDDRILWWFDDLNNVVYGLVLDSLLLVVCFVFCCVCVDFLIDCVAMI